MKTKIVCPLGSKCEDAGKDAKGETYMERCAWYTMLIGKNPQTNKDVEEWGCAMKWLPIMLTENAIQQRHTGAAIESFRNDMIIGNTQLLNNIPIGSAKKSITDKNKGG